jgi:carbonic anhydrase/acetyltransferase-like protein (isoleucine patch superfamily)
VIKSFDGLTPRIAASAFISEEAHIIGDVDIGENSNVWPGAVIRGDLGKITIGQFTNIEDNAVIHSGTTTALTCDMVIGDEVTIGHGAVLNGRFVGNHVLIGMNASILHDSVVGSHCIVGANCVVGEKMVIPDYSLVLGVPGKIRGRLSQAQLEQIDWAGQIYKDLVMKYKKQNT